MFDKFWTFKNIIYSCIKSDHVYKHDSKSSPGSNDNGKRKRACIRKNEKSTFAAKLDIERKVKGKYSFVYGKTRRH